MPTTETVFEALDGANHDTHAIATLGALAHEAQELNDGQLYAVKKGDDVVLVETPGYTRDVEDRLAPRPRQVVREVTVRTVESLIAYLDTHADLDNTDGRYVGPSRDLQNTGFLEVWADLPKRRVHAILDGGDGWRHHEATLELRHSREWAEWLAIDGRLSNQVDFAQFIEDHLSSIGAPDGAQLLDICQTLQAAKSVDFKSSTVLANGQRQFRYEETTEAKAGTKGDLTIPSELTLVLRPFDGSDPVAVQARFRYRINDGHLSMGVKLVEPERVLEQAFAEIVEVIDGAVPVPVLFGNAG